MFDKLAGVTCGLMLVPFLAFSIILYLQHGYIEKGTYRLTVLSTRAAFFLPGYALLLWIGVLDPSAFEGIAVLINLVEGFSFYTFYSMLVYNLGGAAARDSLTMKATGYAVCGCCLPQDKRAFQNSVNWAMFHMLFTRVVLSLIGAIAFYAGGSGGKIINLIMQILCAFLVFNMVLRLVNFFHIVYGQSTNLFGMLKVMLLKCSVGLIVAEGLIAQFLISSGKTPYSDDDGDDHFNEDQKTKRGYCALVLIEICILSLPYLFAFGIKKIRPSEKSLRLSQDASSSSSAALEGAGGAEAGLGVWWERGCPSAPFCHSTYNYGTWWGRTSRRRARQGGWWTTRRTTCNPII